MKMNIVEIIKESAMYPINNIQALIIYFLLAVVIGIVIAATGVGALFAGNLSSIAIAIVGIIIAIALLLLILGYELDILKYAINRREDAPGINFTKNILDGINLLIVNLVYFIVPFIVVLILAIFFKSWLVYLIGVILFVVFALAESMGECRLATQDLNSALSIGDAIGDIFSIGVVKLVVLLILVGIIGAILTAIAGFIAQYIPYIGEILTSLVGIYVTFFSRRALGLIYSDAWLNTTSTITIKKKRINLK